MSTQHVEEAKALLSATSLTPREDAAALRVVEEEAAAAAPCSSSSSNPLPSNEKENSLWSNVNVHNISSLSDCSRSVRTVDNHQEMDCFMTCNCSRNRESESPHPVLSDEEEEEETAIEGGRRGKVSSNFPLKSNAEIKSKKERKKMDFSSVKDYRHITSQRSTSCCYDLSLSSLESVQYKSIYSPSSSLGGNNKKEGDASRSICRKRGSDSQASGISENGIPAPSPVFPRSFPLPPTVDACHWSVFYPNGIDSQPPVLLHYLSLGGWRTVAGGFDYFSHRRLQEGEVVGQDVRWLHGARPRDRFVFVISPVEPKAEGEKECRWYKFREKIYGPPPAFAYRKGKLFRRPSIHVSSEEMMMLKTSEEEKEKKEEEENEFSFGGPTTTTSTANLSAWNVDDAFGSSYNPETRNGDKLKRQEAGERKMRKMGKTPSMGGTPTTATASYHHHQQHQQSYHHSNNTSVSSGKVGVEVIEIRHEDITATDYSPRLLSSRFAIEAKAVYAYYFPTMEEAYAYYDCVHDLQLIEEQIKKGITNKIIYKPKEERRNNVNNSSERQSCSSVFYESEYMGKNTKHTMAKGMSVDRQTELPLHKKVNVKSCERALMDVYDEFSDGEEKERENKGGRGVHSSSKQDPLQGLSTPESMKSDGNHNNKNNNTNYGGGGLEPSMVTKNKNVQNITTVPALPSIRPRLLPQLTTAHFDTILTLYSEDPNFNAVLREVLMPEPGTHTYTISLKEQRRMLSMYETGMPAWTIFLASTGLPYRRIFRLVFVGLVNIWPLISLFVGLYDLYKHLPQMKTFVMSTLAPLLEWVEEHVTFRVSILVTYIISVCLTVATSFTSFLSQFYLLELFLYPFRILGGLLQTPFTLILEMLWAFVFVTGSFFRLLFLTLKMIFAGPFLLVTHLSALELGSTPVLPAAVEGTSLTMKWWRAWQEFWVTVASPVKNLAKAWYDSVVHIAVSAARREASIRRWYTPRLRYVLNFVAEVREICVANVSICWQLCGSSWGLWLLHALLLGYILCLLLVPIESVLFGAKKKEELGEFTQTGMMSILGSSSSGGGVGDVHRGVEEPSLFAGTTMAPEMGKPNVVSALPREDDENGNGFDALYFAWETLVAVWIQLPW